MNQTTSLAHAQTANAVCAWLKSYPDCLLTAEQFLFLSFNTEIHISTSCGFDSAGILDGKWSKAYQWLIDNGKIRLFGYDLVSTHFTDRLKQMNALQVFDDPYRVVQADLASLIYSDLNDIPVTFAYQDFYNHHAKPTEENNLTGDYNRFSNFLRSYCLYSDFVENHYETDLVDLNHRESFMLAFDIEMDVPKIKTANTPEIIEQLREELTPIYYRYSDDLNMGQQFDGLLYANLPDVNYVDMSPDEFIKYRQGVDYVKLRDCYSQIQFETISSANLNEYNGKLQFKNQYCLFEGHGWRMSVNVVRLGFLRNRTLPSAHAGHFRPNAYISNRRLPDNSRWLFTMNNFHPSVNCIIEAIGYSF